jgi:signal transduction histidine kinase
MASAAGAITPSSNSTSRLVKLAGCSDSTAIAPSRVDRARMAMYMPERPIADVPGPSTKRSVTTTGVAEVSARRTGIDVTFEHEGGSPLPFRLERELWRVAQEAVTNVEKHADASHVHVRWWCDRSSALLVVSDDGRGLPERGATRIDAYGMLGMRERADAIGAQLEIESAPGKGTTVRCRLEGR